MASIKCDYCGRYFDESLEFCSGCGAINKNFKRTSNNIPKTIDELKKYCEDKKVPLDKLHFYIGEDYKGTKAFGIYKDEQKQVFVVYKNKSNGQRAIRYEGTDEAYAVNEIYQKLKEKSLEVKSYSIENSKESISKDYSFSPRIHSTKTYFERKETLGDKISYVFSYIAFFLPIFIQILIFLFVVFITFDNDGPNNGYYNYNNKIYYNQSDDWYVYEDDSWIEYDDSNFDENFNSNIDSYYEGSYYYDSYNASDFSTTDYYVDYDYSYDDDWDSGWDDDWDDDWDSGWDDYDYSDSWDSDW